MFEEVSSRPKIEHTKMMTEDGSSRRGGKEDCSQASTSKLSAGTSPSSAATPSGASSQAAPGVQPHGHDGQRSTASSPSEAFVKGSVRKIEGALKARGNKMPDLVRRARDKSYTDIVRTSSSFASCTSSTPPTSAATPADLSTPSSLPVSPSTPSTFVSGLGRVPASRLMREDHPKPALLSAQAQSAASKAMHDGHVMGEWHKLIPGILNDSTSLSNAEILHNLREAAGIIQ